MTNQLSNWYQNFIDNIATSLADSPEMETELDNLLSRIPMPWRNEIKKIIIRKANEYMWQGGGSSIIV